MTEALSLAWSALEGFPQWALVVLWPVVQIVGIVVLALVASLCFAALFLESQAKQHRKQLRARAQAKPQGEAKVYSI